jgi:hypothetical protein
LDNEGICSLILGTIRGITLEEGMDVCKTPNTVSEFVPPNSVSDFAIRREFLLVDNLCDSFLNFVLQI